MKKLMLLVPIFLMAGAPDLSEQGRQLYLENCTACHGPAGTGDGPLAGKLTALPSDLTKIADRREDVWPMLEIMAILDGYSRNTIPREEMPVFENLLDNEMIEFDTGNGMLTLVPKKLIAIVTYLETIQDPKPTSYVP